MTGIRLLVVSEREHSFLDMDDRPELSIGRAPDNDIVLKDDMVSRRHARIEKDAAGRFRVRDLESFNGTYLNERRVRDEAVELWDAVRIGRTKLFLTDRAGDVTAPRQTSSSDGEEPAAAEAPAAAAEPEDDPEEVGAATRVMDVQGASASELLATKEIRAAVEDMVRREREQAEREIARRIRDESAPPVLPAPKGLVVRARRFGPADGGGDFYDCFQTDGDLTAAMGSVSGVGVAACVAATAARHTLRGLLARQTGEPPEAVALLADVLRDTLHPGSAVSLLLAVVGVDGRARLGAVGGTGVLHHAAAAGETRLLRAPGRRDEEAARPEALEVELGAGDRLLLVSDGGGALRRMGEVDPYGAERLQEALAAHADLGPKELVARLVEGYEGYAGGAPDRDATLLVVALA